MNNQQKRPYIGIGTIILRDGKILLGERIDSHGAGTYQIPGGHLEFGQSFSDCVKSEIFEETGLTDIQIDKLISINNDIVYGKHYVSIGILVCAPTGEPFDAEPHKSRNWCWYKSSELPENIFIPSKLVIDAWLSGTLCNELDLYENPID